MEEEAYEAYKGDKSERNADKTPVLAAVPNELMGAWTHHWNDQFRSNLVYGHADLDPASGMDPEFFIFSRHTVANNIWQTGSRWSLGLGGLYGFKAVENGEGSDAALRMPMGMVHALVD